MDFEDAVERLSFHCGANPAIDDPRWEDGFLATLRPYRGLREDAYVDLSACVAAVGDHLRTADQLDRRMVGSLWAIFHYADSWAVHPEGMVRRNNLISPEDLQTLRGWLLDLREEVAMWLPPSEPDSSDAESSTPR